jgi:hypothetical protein
MKDIKKIFSGNANDSNIEGFCVILRMDHLDYLEYNYYHAAPSPTFATGVKIFL